MPKSEVCDHPHGVTNDPRMIHGIHPMVGSMFSNRDGSKPGTTSLTDHLLIWVDSTCLITKPVTTRVPGYQGTRIMPSQSVLVQQSGGIAMAKALQEMAAKAKTMPAPSRADTAPGHSRDNGKGRPSGHLEFLELIKLWVSNLGLPLCPGEHHGQ